MGQFVTAKHYDVLTASVDAKMDNIFTSDTKLNADKSMANRNEKLTPMYVGHEFDLDTDYDVIRVALKTSNGKFVSCIKSSGLNPLGIGYYVSATDEVKGGITEE